MDGKFVSYLRVSTKKQGTSGLGLDAQKTVIETFLNGGNWTVLKEFVEVESGKNADRPVLAAAIEHCKRTGATLLIAKLDRLARNVYFVSSLRNSGVTFVCCDNPHANNFTINILASLAEYEAELISNRTKAALTEAKKRGVVLGKKENLTKEAAASGRVLGAQKNKKDADEFARSIYNVIKSDLESGVSLSRIAARLNSEKILTARNTKWYPTTVKNLLDRLST